jgi:DNA-binding NarL/FixJ family response regulator
MPATSSFLVVEDHAVVSRTMRRMLEPYRPVVIASSVAETLTAGASERIFCGFLIDISLDDGSGLDALAALRTRHPEVPAMIVTGNLERDLVNRAARLRARYVCKPIGEAELLPFVYDALVRESTGEERLTYAVDQLVRQYELNSQMSVLVRHALDGTPRRDIAESLGISENTLKSQIRALLNKMGADSLDDLRVRVYRLALLSLR